MWAVGCSEGNKLYFAKILIVFKWRIGGTVTGELFCITVHNNSRVQLL
jgi:hypothetical protein